MESQESEPRESKDPAGRPPWTPRNIPPPPPAPFPGAAVELRVSKRLLWVSGAAYPLHNIARVYTFTLHPRRADATVRFFKNVAVTLSVAIAMTIFSGVASIGNEDVGSGLLTFVWVAAAAALIYFLGQLVSVLTAPSHYVLAVETSGPSIAMVTSENPQHLDRLVGYITHAIDNPETEFQVKVESIMISPKNYYFGDNVNMYGGTGNIGMAA